MTDIWFYHLESTPIARALPELLEKVVQKGWRAYVHGHQDDRIEGLNSILWAYAPSSFLAHGLEGDELAPRQPVLLGTSGRMVNKPQVYVSISPTGFPSMEGVERCLVVFEGDNDDHLAWARAQWKQLKSEGQSLAYWKQSELGRWEKMQ